MLLGISWLLLCGFPATLRLREALAWCSRRLRKCSIWCESAWCVAVVGEGMSDMAAGWDGRLKSAGLLKLATGGDTILRVVGLSVLPVFGASHGCCGAYMAIVSIV